MIVLMIGPEDAHKLFTAIGDTENLALSASQKLLEFANVEVTVIDCDDPYLNAVPEDIQDICEQIDRPVQRVAGFDMNLTYDRGELLYRPNNINMRLDNNLVLRFDRLPAMRNSEGTFYPQLLDRRGRSLYNREETRLVPEQVVLDTLRDLGVAMPIAPSRGSWDEIQQTLHFSDRWSAVASNRVALDPKRRLYLEERVDGRGFTGDPEVDATPETQLTEIIAAIDESPQAGLAPNSALKFIMRSDDEQDQPSFSALMRVPIHDELVFLGYDAMTRVEVIDKAKLLPITLGTIQYIGKAISSVVEMQ